MQTPQLLAARILWLAGALGLAGAAQADDAACQAVMGSLIKLAGTANHQHATRTAAVPGAPARRTETVVVGTSMWVLSDGQWMAMKFDPQETARNAQGMPGARTCSHERDEAIDGEAASLMAVHSTTPYGSMSTQTWISKSRGLPLRQVIDNETGKTRTEVRFDYANVKPPTAAH